MKYIYWQILKNEEWKYSLIIFFSFVSNILNLCLFLNSNFKLKFVEFREKFFIDGLY